MRLALLARLSSCARTCDASVTGPAERSGPLPDAVGASRGTTSRGNSTLPSTNFIGLTFVTSSTTVCGSGMDTVP